MKSGIAMLLIAATLVGGPSWAAGEESDNGEDITRPRMRLDLRYQYQNTPAESFDNTHTFTVRAETPFALSPHWRFGARLDVPFAYTDTTSGDNVAGRYQFGLADLLFQGLLINHPTAEFAWAAGARFLFPTASQDGMGSGKYRSFRRPARARS